MGSKQTTVQSADPWSGIQPHLKQGADAARGMFNADPNQFQVLPWEGPVNAPESQELKYARNRIGGSAGNLFSSQAAQLGQAQNALGGVMSAGNHLDPRFTSGVNSALSRNNAQPFNSSINRAMGAGTAPMLNQEARQAAQLGPHRALSSGIQGAFNTGGQRQLNAGVAGAQGMGEYNRLGRAVAAQFGGHDPRFNRTVKNMTGDGYDQQLRQQLRQNVNESVMPGMNATFGNSGMTGSSLHQQNLAKGLASGMADTEAAFLDKAQDRQFQAAQAAQSAHSDRLGRMLQGGALGQQSALDRAGLGLDAGVAARNAGLQQGQLGLQAGQTAAGDALDRSQLGLQAGQTLNDAQGALRQQQMQAGGMAQGALQATRGMNLQAGQSAQDAYNANQNRVLDATGMAPGMSAAQYMPFDRMAEVGEARTQRNQNQLAADIMADQQRQAAPIDAINNYMSLLNQTGQGYGSSMSSTSNNPGMLGMLGTGLQGFGLLGSLGLLSDRRAKENIRRVGTLDNGLPVYVYTYKGDDVPHMGVMADEAAEVNPEAVSMRPDGLLQVDYGRIAA